CAGVRPLGGGARGGAALAARLPAPLPVAAPGGGGPRGAVLPRLPDGPPRGALAVAATPAGGAGGAGAPGLERALRARPRARRLRRPAVDGLLPGPGLRLDAGSQRDHRRRGPVPRPVQPLLRGAAPELLPLIGRDHFVGRG